MCSFASGSLDRRNRSRNLNDLKSRAAIDACIFFLHSLSPLYRISSLAREIVITLFSSLACVYVIYNLVTSTLYVQFFSFKKDCIISKSYLFMSERRYAIRNRSYKNSPRIHTGRSMQRISYVYRYIIHAVSRSAKEYIKVNSYIHSRETIGVAHKSFMA